LGDKRPDRTGLVIREASLIASVARGNPEVVLTHVDGVYVSAIEGSDEILRDRMRGLRR
jgi:hypothetical protein